MTRRTDAERIAALFGYDGQRHELEDGRTLEQVAEAAGATHLQHPTKHHLSRLLFDDGSAIVIVDDGSWDIEGRAPWSWESIQDIP